jgi:hypothetical protein
VEKLSAAAMNTGARNLHLVQEMMAFSPRELAQNWEQFSKKITFDPDQLRKELTKEEFGAMSIRDQEAYEDARTVASFEAWHARFIAGDFQMIV